MLWLLIACSPPLERPLPDVADPAVPGWGWPVDAGAVALTDTFGPRMKSSGYDYHRGLDLAVPAGTPMLAVAAGAIRIAGDHEGYTDPLVQIDHGGGLYSNYMHADGWSVEVGERVEAGDVIGATGGTENLEHLHFEIRSGDVNQPDCDHPLRYLGYRDWDDPEILDASVGEGEVVFAVELPGEQPDLVRVEVEVLGPDGATLDGARYDMVEVNRIGTGEEAIEVDPDWGDYVLLEPALFDTRSPRYRIGFTFYALDVAPGDAVRIVAEDARGNRASVAL